MNEYKVSVLITNYNHHTTLRRAIDGALRQIAPFPFEVVVVDDGSFYSSIEILQSYQDRIRLISTAHRGMMTAFKVGISQCKGEYIAWCDADDFWTDTHKISGQAMLLDRFHHVGLVHTEYSVSGIRMISPRSFSVTYDDLLRRGSICASTVMFRASLIDFDRFYNLGFNAQDLPVELEIARKGEIYFLPVNTTVYTVYPESISHTRSRAKRLRHVGDLLKIRMWFIAHYGCKASTIAYLCYRFARDIYSVVFKRWGG